MSAPALGSTTVTNNAVTHFGFGAIEQLGKVLRANGITRPLICTDKGLVDVGLIDRIRTAIPNDITVTVFDGTPANPTEQAVGVAAAMYKENGCDGVLAVGGGSSLDLGKAVTIDVTHEGALAGYTVNNGGLTKIGAVAPLVVVPTTSGTGSEVSRSAIVIIDSGEKSIISSPNLMPCAAICDPDLTIKLPPLLTAATGMDAVTHCIEAVLSPVVNPPAEAIGYDGLYRAVREGHLEKAVADGSDMDARWNMMMASTEGAMAFSKGLGCVHAMSHACGSLQDLRLHHGTLNAVTLPAVLRFNHDHAGTKYDRLRESMGLAPGTDLADAITDLNARLGLPADLKSMGVTEEMIPGLIKHALQDRCTQTNPRKAEQDEYAALFADSMG